MSPMQTLVWSSSTDNRFAEIVSIQFGESMSSENICRLDRHGKVNNHQMMVSFEVDVGTSFITCIQNWTPISVADGDMIDLI